jgi:hypothetical protein
MHLHARILVLGALLMAGTPVVADTLLVEQLAESRTSVDQRPARGQTKSRVEARFGAPQSRSAAVGQPPISRWDYPGFVVFFEYDHVVHAVGR